MTSNSTVPSQPIPTSSSSSSSTAIPLTNDNVGPDSLATLEETRNATVSPPIDPTKLNNQPVPLPSPPLHPTHSNGTGSSPSHTESNTTLRSPTGELGGGATIESAYLDGAMPVEPSSHPTIAETGVLSQSPVDGPGPKQGQLKRAEKPKSDEGIIKLGSLGGEGLKIKPPTESPTGH
ncbi:hypothetical protein I302_108607 [Kwoniella bestiolae CBS 10118]|uniref:Uncharacterized protein n=1 Tax=Kwoniella bestiolae CBS 10118 TaxID=1296100 RepID=A0A1B9FTL3_9TREE|nr:hypothetical protein I302_07745 [Kwoniella bestiolae CBS 10118]OCF22103.1 hypothetical protein I302_07745 [Kwoniella bestiolae CBS 10118]